MAPELIKVGCLRIEVLSYMNAREWIWKVTAYLKGEDFWTSIETVLEEWRAQKSDKTSESAITETVEISKKADDSMIEKNILIH